MARRGGERDTPYPTDLYRTTAESHACHYIMSLYSEAYLYTAVYQLQLTEQYAHFTENLNLFVCQKTATAYTRDRPQTTCVCVETRHESRLSSLAFVCTLSESDSDTRDTRILFLNALQAQSTKCKMQRTIVHGTL